MIFKFKFFQEKKETRLDIIHPGERQYEANINRRQRRAFYRMSVREDDHDNQII